MQLGTTVTWVSQAQGYEVKKTGIVVAIVPANHHVSNHIPFGMKLLGMPGLSRPHESYLVEVSGKTERSKSKLYWPRVSSLEIVKGR